MQVSKIKFRGEEVEVPQSEVDFFIKKGAELVGAKKPAAKKPTAKKEVKEETKNTK